MTRMGFFAYTVIGYLKRYGFQHCNKRSRRKLTLTVTLNFSGIQGVSFIRIVTLQMCRLITLLHYFEVCFLPCSYFVL